MACRPTSDSCICSAGVGRTEFLPPTPMKSPITLTSGLRAFAAAPAPPYTGSGPEGVKGAPAGNSTWAGAAGASTGRAVAPASAGAGGAAWVAGGAATAAAVDEVPAA